MNTPIFNDTVQFSFSFDMGGAHPDLGVEWHCYGECALKVYQNGNEYEQEFDMLRFFMCADATTETLHHQYKAVDFYNQDFQKRNREVINWIEIAITEASMSPEKKDVAGFFAFQDKIVKQEAMITTYEIVHTQTVAA